MASLDQMLSQQITAVIIIVPDIDRGGKRRVISSHKQDGNSLFAQSFIQVKVGIWQRGFCTLRQQPPDGRVRQSFQYPAFLGDLEPGGIDIGMIALFPKYGFDICQKGGSRIFFRVAYDDGDTIFHGSQTGGERTAAAPFFDQAFFGQKSQGRTDGLSAYLILCAETVFGRQFVNMSRMVQNLFPETVGKTNVFCRHISSSPFSGMKASYHIGTRGSTIFRDIKISCRFPAICGRHVPVSFSGGK